MEGKHHMFRRNHTRESAGACTGTCTCTCGGGGVGKRGKTRAHRRRLLQCLVDRPRLHAQDPLCIPQLLHEPLALKEHLRVVGDHLLHAFVEGGKLGGTTDRA
eukprot:183512-Pleurochrysis_carterae.AAC.6